MLSKRVVYYDAIISVNRDVNGGKIGIDSRITCGLSRG